VRLTPPTSGICLGFVQQALAAGAKILIADLALTDAAQKLVDAEEDVVFQKTDVAQWDQLQRIIDVAKERFGEVPDVYVAGAGVFEPVCLVSFFSSFSFGVHVEMGVGVSGHGGVWQVVV